MACKFSLQKTRDARFFFTLHGEDGTELLRGLPYYSKMQARKVAESVPQCLRDQDKVFHHSSHGELYFVVHNGQHEMIARSPHMHGPLAVHEILEEARTAAARAIFVDATERIVRRAAAF